MSHSAKSQLDQLVGRILFVDVQPVEADAAAQTERRTENAFGLSLLFSGVRCILQYAILPFVLPVLGIASDAAVPLMLVISILALISIIASVRRFWKIGYRYRWQYLGVAIVALILLGAFITLDLQTLLNG